LAFGIEGVNVDGIEIEKRSLTMNISAPADFTFMRGHPLDIDLGPSYLICVLPSSIFFIGEDCANRESA
jgi:hypothetical protein